MIVEVKKDGILLLRSELATVIEMFASGAGTFRPKCAELAHRLENFSILRPYTLSVSISMFRLEETIEEDPRDEDEASA